jgi:hypothetical protein
MHIAKLAKVTKNNITGETCLLFLGVNISDLRHSVIFNFKTYQAIKEIKNKGVFARKNTKLGCV